MLASQEPAGQQHQGAAQERQGRIQGGAVRRLHFAGVDDTNRPRDGADEDREEPGQHLRGGGYIRPEEQRDAGSAQRKSGPGHASRPRTQLQQRQQESHDRRLDGDHQGRHSGRHAQLRPVEQPVADEKEEKAEDDPGAPSLASRPLSFPQRPGEEDGARNQMTGRGGEQRRDRLDSVADGEESRAPDHVDGKEGEDRLDPAGPRAWKGGSVGPDGTHRDRKSTRLNSSHSQISYAVFCLKKKKKIKKKDFKNEIINKYDINSKVEIGP